MIFARASSLVVDFGAGTGAFALALAPHVARIIAIDPSAAMVAAMREQRVEAVCGGFLSYEHEGDPPDPDGVTLDGLRQSSPGQRRSRRLQLRGWVARAR